MPETTPEMSALFAALDDACSRSALQFHQFMGAHELVVYQLLEPYGYRGSHRTPDGTVRDFRAAYGRYLDALLIGQRGPGYRPAQPPSRLELELAMWETAATDPICAVYIGTSYLLAWLTGEDLDPAATTATATVVAGVVGILTWRNISNRPIKRGKNKTVFWLRNQYGDRLTVSSKNSRREQLTGRIKKTHIRQGTGTSTGARKAVQEEGDYDAGHLRARLLGGKGDVPGTFPQLSAANRGKFRELEGKIAELAKNSTNSDSIIFSVKLNYSSESSKSPTSVSYYIRINGQTVGRANFSNQGTATVEFPLRDSSGARLE